MPKRRGQGTTPKGGDIPATIMRSDKHAQAIWAKTHDSAVETYGEGRRAHMVAFASLKHSYKKVGDHWVKKDHKGPSDPQAARGPTTEKKSTDRDKPPPPMAASPRRRPRRGRKPRRTNATTTGHAGRGRREAENRDRARRRTASDEQEHKRDTDILDHVRAESLLGLPFAH
jgi:cation transport regulator ChaB